MNIDPETQYANVVMFVGTTPGVGTTAAAFRIATALAVGSPNSRIAYLCLNLKSSKIGRYIGLTAKHAGVSALRSELKARSLTEDRLLKHCVTIKPFPNLHILNGNMQREQAELFAPEDIEQLLWTASRAFDISIVDVNAYWDNAATIITAIRAGGKYIVTAPQIDCFQDDFRSWICNTAPLFGVSPRQFSLIVTQTGRLADEYSESEVLHSTGLPLTASISYEEDLMRCMQQGQFADWIKSRRSVHRSLTDIAAKLAAKAGMLWTPPPEPKLLAKFRLRTSRRQAGVDMR